MPTPNNSDIDFSDRVRVVSLGTDFDQLRIKAENIQVAGGWHRELGAEGVVLAFVTSPYGVANVHNNHVLVIQHDPPYGNDKGVYTFEELEKI